MWQRPIDRNRNRGLSLQLYDENNLPYVRERTECSYMGTDNFGKRMQDDSQLG